MEENEKIEEIVNEPKNDFQEFLDKAKELESINFKDVTDFDYVEYYGAIEKIARQNNVIKNSEAENLVKEFAEKVIDKDFVVSIQEKKDSILSFIRKYDPNTDIIKNMSEHDVDKVYAISNYLVNSYIKYLNDMSFNFELTSNEFKFLHKVLTQQTEYNGDDVFNYVEFYENFWLDAKEYVDKHNGEEKYVFKINIKMILILHHLIKNFKVKGNTQEFKHFRNILYRIAQTNKLFNAYNIIVERIKEDCKLWGAALDEALAPREEQAQVEEVKQLDPNQPTQE